MTLDLNLVHCFAVLAEELHYGRAAARLHVAQPTLTHRIQSLERELGVALLDRGPRGVELTAAGVELARRAPDVLEAADAAVAGVRDAAGLRAPLRIGFMGSAGRELLPEALRRWRSERPEEESVEVRELLLPRTNAALREREVDIAFVRPIGEDAELVIEPLPPDPLVAVLPLDHPRAAAPELALRDLAGETFVRAQAESVAELWGRFIFATCAEHGFEPQMSAESAGSVQAVVGLVAAGRGVSVMSATTHALPREGVAAVPIVDATMPLALAYRRGAPPPVLAFVALVRELAAQTSGR